MGYFSALTRLYRVTSPRLVTQRGAFSLVSKAHYRTVNNKSQNCVVRPHAKSVTVLKGVKSPPARVYVTPSEKDLEKAVEQMVAR